jgi:hypothetical protein
VGDGGEDRDYIPPTLANPGNFLVTEEEDMGSSVLHAITGGGHLGWEDAHENEAPFPEKVPRFFIESFTRPGDLVLDIFSGSGTTIRVALSLGRRSIGFDIRQSQAELGIRGMAAVRSETEVAG